MFELIVVFSALTAPVPVPVQQPAEATALPAIVEVAASAGGAQLSRASSAATIASHSASSEPVAAERLARAYQ
jgi:hypothetical protein